MPINWKSIAGSTARSIASRFPVSFFGDKTFSPGVSANIITRNDPWFLESLLSVIDMVDEIIIVDSSTDFYSSYNRNIVTKLKNKKINYFQEELNIKEAREMAKSKSTKEIIFHWDADMVTTVEGKDFIKDLLGKLKSYNGKFVFYFPIVTFFMNFSTVISNYYHLEGWIYSNSNKDFYKPRFEEKDKGTMVEGFSPPLYFRKLNHKGPLALHLSLMMPEEKLFQKRLQKLWMNPEFKRQYSNFEDMKNKCSQSIDLGLEYEKEIYDDSKFGKIPLCLERFKGLEVDVIVEKKLNEIKQMEFPFI